MSESSAVILGKNKAAQTNVAAFWWDRVASSRQREQWNTSFRGEWVSVLGQCLRMERIKSWSRAHSTVPSM